MKIGFKKETKELRIGRRKLESIKSDRSRRGWEGKYKNRFQGAKSYDKEIFGSNVNGAWSNEINNGTIG